MIDRDFSVLMHFVDKHGGRLGQRDSLFAFYDYLSALRASLEDKWNVCNFDKWLAFQMVAQLEQTEVGESSSVEEVLVGLDTQFDNFATIDSRIRMQVGFIVHLTPGSEYLVPWMTSCYSFAYDLSNLDSSVVAFYDLHHFVTINDGNLYVHAYKREPVQLPGRPGLGFKNTNTQSNDVSTQSMYDPSGWFVLIRNFGEQSAGSDFAVCFTVCTRHAEVLYPKLELRSTSLAVLTPDFAVVLQQRGLCMFDLFTSELKMSVEVAPALYCHLAASCMGDIENGCVVWCQAKQGLHQSLVVEDVVAFTNHDKKLFKALTNVQQSAESLSVACTNNTLLHVASTVQTHASKKPKVTYTTINLKKQRIAKFVGYLAQDGLGIYTARVPETCQLSNNAKAFEIYSTKFALPVKMTSIALSEWFAINTPSEDVLSHFCVGNLKTVSVLHVANLNAHVCLMGEKHTLFTSSECTSVVMLLERLFELVESTKTKMVDVFVENQQPKHANSSGTNSDTILGPSYPSYPSYHIEPKSEYLEGGQVYSALRNVQEFFARHKGNIRIHNFNVRERVGRLKLVTLYMPKHAHKFLHETSMPDKRDMKDYFLQHAVHDSDDEDLYGEYMQASGPAFLAGLNEKLIASFKEIKLPDSVKAKLSVASLRTVLYGNKHNKHTSQVLLTDILVFYNWLAQHNPADNTPSYTFMYAGDHHVRNMRSMIQYLARVCESHVLEADLLQPGASFDIDLVDKLFEEWFARPTQFAV
jgi:hypothetical protein